MDIRQMLDQKRFTLSFEVFPPVREGNLENLYAAITDLEELNPDFISVTYGAGGSTRDKSLEIASKVKNEFKKEVLAHLSLVERDTQFYVSSYALDGWLDSGPGNTATIPGRLAAVQAIAPTLASLLDRYLADEQETVALLRGLSEETVAHKARTNRIGQTMAFLPIHTRDHIEQIKTIVKAVRAG